MRFLSGILKGLGLVIFFLSMESVAQYVVREGDEAGLTPSRTVVVPYVFSTKVLGFGMGLGGTYGPKSEAIYYGTFFVTDNGSSLFMVGGNNIRIPKTTRWHVRPSLILGHYTKMRLFIDGNPNYPLERAGSNESSPGNYREEDARDQLLDLEFRYTLPWGHYHEEAVHTYVTDNGLLKENPSGATSFNPFKSGQSTVVFQPYYRKQYSDEEIQETLFFRMGYKHNNCDFIPNPHRGYLLKMGVSHDPDWLANTRKWTSLDAELNGYIPLWNPAWSRQQTLALSVWAAYSPTYDKTPDAESSGIPPYFAGPTLGGFWRLRGYTSFRFHDKAAIYYGAEYRVMPEWQPFDKIKILTPLKIRWWQIVGLVEAGRVAPSWNVDMLHRDMKYDVGIGLRGMFYSSVGRIDFVVSDEEFTFSAMIGQSF